MRVLIIRPLIERGGASRAIIQLVQGLQQHGIDVIVASTGGEWLNQLEKITTCYHVPLFPSSVQNIIRSSLLLRRIVRDEKIDLINSHHRFSGLISNLNAKYFQTPVVSTVHEIKADRTFISSFTVGKYAIVFSQAVKKHLTEVCGLSPEFVFQVPVGITFEQPKYDDITKVYQSFNLTDQLPVITSIARFSEEKGCATYLRAIALVLESGIRAQFLLVGDGPLRNELKHISKDLHLEENIHITGWREDINAIIAISNFLVMPSLSEALGISIIEGFLLGKSTIASNIGGIPELIEHKKNGLLVHPNDPHELAMAIISLIKRPDLSKKYGQVGKEGAINRYTPSNMVTETIRVYKAVYQLSKGSSLPNIE